MCVSCIAFDNVSSYRAGESFYVAPFAVPV